jgi:hypothetical protein
MSTDIELEPYREVIDIMAARIKRAEQHNTYLSEAVSSARSALNGSIPSLRMWRGNQALHWRRRRLISWSHATPS